MALSVQAARELTEKLFQEVSGRRGFVAKTEDYYRGKQKLRFASDKWAEYNAARYKDFSDNWCSPVANSPNERLKVTGFRLDDDPSRSDVEKGLWRDWQASNMEAQSSQGFLSGITAARSYALVWGTADDEPVSTWERADQVTVAYDPEYPTRETAALKTWHDGSTEFATLYTTDQVWKWQRKYLERTPATDGPMPLRAEAFFRTPGGLLVAGEHGGWDMRQPAGDDKWPLDNPMGVVPIVELPNRPLLGSEPLSEITGTMAMQDAINLLWAYLFNQADFASMPARVVMGQEPPKIPILDENGQVVGHKAVDLKKLAEDRILWLTGEKASIGQWEAAKLDVFTNVIEVAVTHLAAQTRTPPHYLVLGKGLVNVNAEGMKTAETGLVHKVREMQLFLGQGVRGIFQRYALVRGNKGAADTARFGVVEWKDAENHSEAQLVDALQKLSAIGFPFPWLAERYGLSQTELERVMAMRETEREADPVNTIARGLAETGAPADVG